MSEIYLYKNRPDSSMIYLNRYFEIDPSDDNANYFLAYAYLMMNKPVESANVCENILKHNHKYMAAYTILRDIYLNQNNLFGNLLLLLIK